MTDFASKSVTTINRAELVKALTVLNRVVEKRNIIPILSFIRFDGDKKDVTISGTDLDMETKIRLLSAKSKGVFAFTVNCAKLFDIARKSKSDDVAIFPATETSSKIKLLFGRLEMTMDSLPCNDYPALEPGKVEHSFSIEAPLLHDMLLRTSPCISMEEARYYLNGCYFTRPDGHSKKFRIVATDGHRLGLHDIAVPDGAEKWPNSIIPSKTIHSVMEACKDFKGGTMAVSYGKPDDNTPRVTFKIGNRTITTKLIDGVFPDYMRVIPTGNDKTLCLNRAEMISAINEVTSILPSSMRKVKMVLNGKTTFVASNPDTGTAKLSIDGELVEPDGKGGTQPAQLDIGFNPNYLLAILDSLRSNAVLIRLADPGSPTLFEGVDKADKGVLFVQMPMCV